MCALFVLGRAAFCVHSGKTPYTDDVTQLHKAHIPLFFYGVQLPWVLLVVSCVHFPDSNLYTLTDACFHA